MLLPHTIYYLHKYSTTSINNHESNDESLDHDAIAYVAGEDEGESPTIQEEEEDDDGDGQQEEHKNGALLQAEEIPQAFSAEEKGGGSESLIKQREEEMDMPELETNRVSHYQPSPNPKIIEVTWHPPCFGSVKINTDGTRKSDFGKVGSGGVFRDYHGCVHRAFCSNLDVPSAVHVEVLDVIKAIKLAWLHAWHNVWIETDSLLVTQFFCSPHLFPWHLRFDWHNCLHRLQYMLFKISHIFRKGNHRVDTLANHDVQGSGFTWWDIAPSFILSSSSGPAGHA
ncbi:unnamed protein product [Prunus armeniaca]